MAIESRRERARFLEVMRRFRREGCALLVVGDVPNRAWAKIARLLLGEPRSDRRLLLGVDPIDERTRVSIDGCGVRRIAFDAGVPSEESRRRFCERLERAIDELGAGSTAVDECRLWIPIGRTARAAEPAARDAFLERAVAAVSGGRVRGHCAFAGDYAAAREEGLPSRFDAVIEHRIERGELNQRWRVSAEGITTPWVAVSSARRDRR